MQDKKTQVRSFIEQNFIMGARATPFTDTDSFIEHHIIDSTGFLELITFIEETWGIVVDDNDMVPENLDSLQAIDAFLARKHG